MRYKIFFVIVIYFTYCSNAYTINIAELSISQDITSLPSVYILKANDKDSIQYILDYLDTSEQFKDYEQLSVEQNWLFFQVNNSAPILQYLYINTRYADKIDVYVVDSFGKYTYYFGGALVPIDQAQNNYNNNLLELPIQANSNMKVYLHFYKYIPYKYPKQIEVFNAKYFRKFLNNGYYYSKLTDSFFIFFAGASLFAFFFVLFLYYYMRQTIFLLYSLYLLSVFIFNLPGIKSTPIIADIFPFQSNLYYALHEPSMFFFCGVYGLFLLKILEINKEKNYYIYNIIYYSSIFILCFTVFLSIWIYVFKYPFRDIVYNWSRLIVNIISLLIPFLILRIESPYKNIVLVGTSIFVITGLISFVFDDVLHLKFRVFNYYLNYLVVLKLGILAESLFFAMALGKRTYLIEQERLINYKKYINEMELKNTLSIKINEIKMEALKAQFQPHFMFNSLNSINYLILNNEPSKASEYIGKFSKLFRNTLESSKEDTTSLANELSIAKLYIELEQERLNNSFKFEILIDEFINTEKIQIPSLLFQPILENAIWHGIQLSDNIDKKIQIKIFQENADIIILIYDNGIGKLNKGDSKTLKKSFGLNVTKEKIAIFNTTHKEIMRFAINYNPIHHHNIGTEIRIEIKA